MNQDVDDSPSGLPSELPLQHVFLEEFRRLKSEQLSRIADRDHLLYAHLAVVAGTWTYVLEHRELAAVILALPFAGFVLGSLHLANDLKVSLIRKYISGPLRRDLGFSVTASTSLFGWEEFHRSTSSHHTMKVFDAVTFILSFIAPGVVAICFAIQEDAVWSIPSIGLSLMGAGLLLALLTAFIKYTREGKP